MSLARLQQPESGVDLGEAYASTFSVSVSNVIRTNRNGGRSTSGANQHSNTVASDFSINIIAPGGSRGIKAAIPALKKAIEALEAEDEDNIDQESPLKLMDNAFLISTQKQFDTHVFRIERRKAKPADEAETNKGLGDKVYEEEHD